jgi:hypothetical protein
VLLQSKFVALDTNDWAAWMRDGISPDPAARSRALTFREALLQDGYVILLTLHHVQELMAHENDDIVHKRLDFIRRLPFVGYLAAANGGAGVASIHDVIAAEATAALSGEGLLAVRDTVKAVLFKVGTGDDVMPDPASVTRAIAEESRLHSDHDSTVAAIAQFAVIDPNTKVWDLAAQPLGDPAEVEAKLQTIGRSLSAHITERGDKRASSDADTRSAWFVENLNRIREGLPGSMKELMLESQARRGIDAAEIGPNATLANLDELAVFYNDLQVAAEKTGIPFTTLKQKVTRDQLPLRVVRDALRLHGQKRLEQPGSNLNDGYLAGLSAYCDVVFVDKRTCEDFRQARQKVPALDTLIGRIERSGGDYTTIPERLRLRQ